MANSNAQYKGWTNYETWRFNSYITDDEKNSSYLDELIADVKATYALEDHSKKLAKRIKEWIKNDVAEEEFSLAGDLINAALTRVNWLEIAEEALADFWTEQ